MIAEEKNIRFECYKCKEFYIASPQEYKTVFWHGDIIKESFCPYCGAINQINTTSGFSGSGGGKF